MDENILNKLRELSDVINNVVRNKSSQKEHIVDFKNDELLHSAAVMCRSLSFQKKALTSLSPYTPMPRMLLELYIAKSIMKKTSVTDLALFAEVPATTALRYIDLLQRRNFITREADQSDKRRCWLCLTDKGLEVAENILRSFRTDVNADLSQCLLQR